MTKFSATKLLLTLSCLINSVPSMAGQVKYRLELTHVDGYFYQNHFNPAVEKRIAREHCDGFSTKMLPVAEMIPSSTSVASTVLAWVCFESFPGRKFVIPKILIQSSDDAGLDQVYSTAEPNDNESVSSFSHRKLDLWTKINDENGVKAQEKLEQRCSDINGTLGLSTQVKPLPNDEQVLISTVVGVCFPKPKPVNHKAI